MTQSGGSSPTLGLMPATQKRPRQVDYSPTPVAWIPADNLPVEDAVLESEGGIMLLDPLAHSEQGAQSGGLVPRDDVTETGQAAVAGAQPGVEAPYTSTNGWFQSTWEVAKLSLLIIALLSMMWTARNHSLPLAMWAVY